MMLVLASLTWGLMLSYLQAVIPDVASGVTYLRLFLLDRIEFANYHMSITSPLNVMPFLFLLITIVTSQIDEQREHRSMSMMAIHRRSRRAFYVDRLLHIGRSLLYGVLLIDTVGMVLTLGLSWLKHYPIPIGEVMESQVYFVKLYFFLFALLLFYDVIVFRGRDQARILKLVAVVFAVIFVDIMIGSSLVVYANSQVKQIWFLTFWIGMGFMAIALSYYQIVIKKGDIDD